MSAGASLFFPLLLTALGSGMREAMRNGGFGMFVVAFFGAVTTLAVSVMGGLVVRGRRIPPGVFVAIAVVPVLFAIMFAAYNYRRMIMAIATVDSTQRYAIMALGTSENANLDLLGSLASAFAMATAAIALFGSLATIDVQRLGARPSLGRLAPIVAGVLAALVAMGVAAFFSPRPGGLPMRFTHVVGIGLMTAAMTGAARASAVLRAWHDEKEARHALASFVAGALAVVAALVLFERAAAALADVVTLPALAGDPFRRGLDPSQRAVILAELSRAHVAFVAGAAAQAVLFTVAGGVAVVGGATAKRHPLTPSVVVALVMLVIAALAVIGRSAMTYDLSAFLAA